MTMFSEYTKTTIIEYVNSAGNFYTLDDIVHVMNYLEREVLLLLDFKLNFPTDELKQLENAITMAHSPQNVCFIENNKRRKLNPID
jgi:hypothetical protein